MHKNYTQVVKAKFGVALTEALPKFALSKLQRKAFGGRLYQYAPCSDLTLFIALVIHNNSDDFNVDVGFSRAGSCPEESFFLTPSDTLDLPSILFRLWEFNGGEDPGWVIEDYLPVAEARRRFEETGTTALPPEKCLPRIDALIADAVSNLLEDAAPYFALLEDRIC